MLSHFSADQFPYLSAATLSLILVFYLLKREDFLGKRPLVSLLVMILLWTIAGAIEHQPDALPGSIDRLSNVILIWLPACWLLFVHSFYQQGRPQPSSWFPLAVVFLTGMVMLGTQRWDHFLSGPTTLISGPSIRIIYMNLVVLVTVALLILLLRRSRGHLLAQVVILLVCTLFPFVSNLLIFALVPGASSLEVLPYTLNVIAGLFILGLMRFRLLNIMPIDYASMVNGIRDAILVVNSQNIVVHINHTAETLFGKTAAEMRGLPTAQAFSRYPLLLQNCCKEDLLTNIPLETSHGLTHYEMHVSQLKDHYGYPVGRLISLHNITIRVQAENASRQSQNLLQQSEEKYRSLVENSHDVIFSTDRQGNVTYISPAVEQLSGYSPQDLIGTSYRAFLHPDDLPLLEGNHQHALSSQLPALEFRLLDRSGGIHYVRVSSSIVHQDNEPVGVHGILSDITERIQVERALERRAAQLTLLNDIGEQIASVIELDSVLDNATQLIQTKFGYYHVAIFTPDEEHSELRMRSTSGAYSQLFPINHRLMFGQGIVGWTAVNQSTLLANDVRTEPRYTNLYPDKILTRSELAVPILVGDKMLGVLDMQSPQPHAFDENDVRVMETVADQIAIAMENAHLYEEVRRQLKERERNEYMLRVQRDLLIRLNSAKSLQETLGLAVDILAEQLNAGRVTIFMVDWDCQMVQPVISKGEGVHPSLLPQPLDHSLAGWVARCAQPVLSTDTSADPFCSPWSIAGLSVLCVPLMLNNVVMGEIYLEDERAEAFTQDDLRLLSNLSNSLIVLIERVRLFEEVIQARGELEQRAQELEEANASLRELDRLKSQFLANMSHELRTPLNSIIGFSEVLVDHLSGPLNPEQEEFVEDILDSGKHLLALINDLLDFSKIEAGQMPLEISTFEVDTLFEELRATITPLAERKSQTLVFRKAPTLPALTADHLRIRQVFINLLGNANKFTPEGGSITVSCDEDKPGWLTFRVEDTGIGIRPEDHDLIFEEFRQVDGSLTREVAGTGLGLAISKSIVQKHNGKIWVESELEQGSIFFVRLPVKPLPA